MEEGVGGGGKGEEGRGRREGEEDNCGIIAHGRAQANTKVL